jgi:hypothetical protein
VQKNGKKLQFILIFMTFLNLKKEIPKNCVGNFQKRTDGLSETEGAKLKT